MRKGGQLPDLASESLRSKDLGLNWAIAAWFQQVLLSLPSKLRPTYGHSPLLPTGDRVPQPHTAAA